MAFWSGNYQDDVYVADFDERGGLPQEIVPDQPGWLLPRCTPRHGCVLNELGKKSLNVWSLDPLRGKGPLLAALRFDALRLHRRRQRAAKSRPPDLVPWRAGARHRGGECEVSQQPRLAVDWHWLFSVEFGFQPDADVHHPRWPRALWAPERILVEAGIPSPDGKHLAIQASTGLANLWMMTGSEK
jgi:hypothetical protein